MILISVALRGREATWTFVFKAKNSADSEMEQIQYAIRDGHEIMVIEDDYGSKAIVRIDELAGLLLEDYAQATPGAIARNIANAHLQIDIQRAVQRDEKVAAASKLVAGMQTLQSMQPGRA